MSAAFAATLADRRALAAGSAITLATLVLFLGAGQMLAWDDGVPRLLVSPERLALFAGLALLAGLDGALQFAAIQLRLGQPGTPAGALGVLFAVLGATCCTPLVWPAVLSLLGVSGVSLLGLNAALHRGFWPLVSVAAIGLLVGIGLAARVLTAACALPRQQAPGDQSPAGADADLVS